VSSEPVTLDNCAREPIHIPGSIQPHGVLFACSGDEAVVTQVSANVEAWCGRSAGEVLGAPLSSVLSAGSAADLALALRHRVLREVSPLRVVLASGSALDATLHRSGDHVIVELERASETSSAYPRGFDPRLRASVMHLQQASDVRTLCEVAAKEVRLVTSPGSGRCSSRMRTTRARCCSSCSASAAPRCCPRAARPRPSRSCARRRST
jgi:chemotaxis family two-component system sensor kinase Cph1